MTGPSKLNPINYVGFTGHRCPVGIEPGQDAGFALPLDVPRQGVLGQPAGRLGRVDEAFAIGAEALHGSRDGVGEQPGPGVHRRGDARDAIHELLVVHREPVRADRRQLAAERPSPDDGARGQGAEGVGLQVPAELVPREVCKQQLSGGSGVRERGEAGRHLRDAKPEPPLLMAEKGDLALDPAGEEGILPRRHAELVERHEQPVGDGGLAPERVAEDADRRAQAIAALRVADQHPLVDESGHEMVRGGKRGVDLGRDLRQAGRPLVALRDEPEHLDGPRDGLDARARTRLLGLGAFHILKHPRHPRFRPSRLSRPVRSGSSAGCEKVSAKPDCAGTSWRIEGSPRCGSASGSTL
jgi:hypothetical protein